MIRLEMKKHNMTSIEELQKYQSYHQVKKYLTGEKILPFNQKQIIEQAKFTYSPLRKAFETQTTAIEDQGEKQVKAIQDNKKQPANINETYENKLLLSKEREIFKNIYNKKLDKLKKLIKDKDKEVD